MASGEDADWARPTWSAGCAAAGCPLDPAAAIGALERALRAASPTLTVADVDWERFVPGFTAVRPSALLARACPGAGAARGAGPRRPPSGGAAELTRAAGRARRSRAGTAPRSTLVRRQVAAACSATPVDGVDAERAFTRARLRLPDGGRAAQPAQRCHRAAAARHAGLRLPDHRVALAAAAQRPSWEPAPTATGLPALAELDRLEQVLAALSPRTTAATRIAARLQALLTRWSGVEEPMEEAAEPVPTASASGSTPPPRTRSSP